MRRYVPKTYKNRRALRVIIGAIVAAALAALILFIVLFFSLWDYFDGEHLHWPPERTGDPVGEYYEYYDEIEEEQNGEG
ncbi:MAG: hypothetical protein FWC96_09960 [Oscillospiraceae bacterium]|nr:hypothetical protein [Oscillospiraceae bacterium]